MHTTERTPTLTRRDTLIFGVLALIASVVITRGLIAAPSFTDAYYHYNAAIRLASGDGLTEPYLWTYIGAPETWPASGVVPSHLYWMPLTSVIAGFGMGIVGAPGDYFAAQWPFTLLLMGTALLGFWLGGRMGGTQRHAWVVGLLTLFSGFYTRFWGTIDTFAPYAFIGALSLIALGMAAERGGNTQPGVRGFAVGGGLAALGHLTRADGLLLLGIGWLLIAWPWSKLQIRQRIALLFLITTAYALVMSPWFIRNLNAIGTPLPLGGTQAIWFTEYNDLFNFPPDSNPATLFADGLSTLISSRLEALQSNLGTFIAVEGLIAMTPLMLIGLWVRRRDPFVRPFWLYALGLHIAMTLIFPYPGYRGGLLHSAAALIPWWAALGVIGLDTVVDWLAKRRRRWNARTAKWIFSGGLVSLALLLSVSIGWNGRVPPRTQTPALYTALSERLPADSRLMINDPAILYHFTGFGGVVLPNADPDVIPEIARRYQIDYVLLESRAATPARLWPLFDSPPDFLTELPLDDSDDSLNNFDDLGATLYAITR
ncbi:MAG: hypothetical protein GYB67_16050 [Chloroflexi bacterium]|nr:hypothetical protein [Chloroflexota bacterium]